MKGDVATWRRFHHSGRRETEAQCPFRSDKDARETSLKYTCHILHFRASDLDGCSAFLELPGQIPEVAGLNPPTKPATSKTQSQWAVEVLRTAILDLVLAPGKPIDEKSLMEEFGLGRTPIREALHELVAERLIEIEPKKGAIVTPLDFSRLRHFFDANAVAAQLVAHFVNIHQEGLAERLAEIQAHHDRCVAEVDILPLSRVNTAFHRLLVSAMDNDYLQDFCERILHHDQRITYFVLRIEKESNELDLSRLETARRQHWQIIDCVRKRDKVALAAAIVPHNSLTQARLSTFLERTRGRDFEFLPLAVGG
jgi:DNA-binding GntR family transcriptional regulator